LPQEYAELLAGSWSPKLPTVPGVSIQ